MVSDHGSSLSEHTSSSAVDGGFSYERLYVEEGGPRTGEPILLLHGWGSSSANMRVIARALEGEYHVVNVDLPGHGHSPAPSVGLGVPEHAQLVAEIIRHRMTAPVTVIGHSNGGRIALYMASEPAYQPLIKRLILISPSGVTPRRSAGYYVKRSIAASLKAPFQILPEPLREFGLDWLRHSLVWRALGSSDYRSLDGAMRETFVKTVSYHLDDRLDRIRVPTLLIWGDRDTAVSRRQMEILESRIPDSGMVVLKDAGHYGYLDDFETFIGAVRYFLENS